MLVAGCCKSAKPSPHKVTGTPTPTDPCPGVVYPDQATSPYVLPYPVGVKHNIRQGNCNDANSHNVKTGEQFAYDFEMPIGSDVVAARGGKVLYTIDKFTNDQHELEQANGLYIDHGDGTYARYGHLTLHGVLVTPGQEVVAGQKVGLSGNSGLSKAPHLHFSVTQCPDPKNLRSSDCYSAPLTFRNTRPHPRGLIGSPTSEIGAGEWYEALPPAGAVQKK
jgi:murein DD-endopeptidase MepM/ murein hydrolase activator NlpD